MEEKVINLEEEWLSRDLSQCMAEVCALKERGIMALEQAKNVIDAHRTKPDIRYSYFRKEYVGAFMRLESTEEGYEQLVERFFNFMEGTLEYYLWIFKDEAFEGDMEMLPAEAKAAVWLNRMFSREVQDWEGKLADLREAAKYYPILGNNIKRLAQLIGEKQSAQQTESANAASEELQQMLVIMKDKIRFMIQQGMAEAAKDVLVQVRTLAPEDEELVQMEEILRG